MAKTGIDSIMATLFLMTGHSLMARGIPRLLFICLLVALPWIPQGAHADADAWRFELTPYLWVPVSIDGDSTVDGTTAPVDLSLGDLLDHFQFALTGRAEAWKGNWGVIFDGMYVDLGGDLSTPGPMADLNITQWVADGLVSYRFLDRPIGVSGPNNAAHGRVTMELMAGLRFVDLKQEITLSPGIKLGGSENYLEPVVGARVQWRTSDKWFFVVRGDASGFGVGDGSDLTWNVLAGAGYAIAPNKTLKIGYRIQDVDWETGTGRDTMGFDATLHGPWLGLTFKF
jgi:opacity protein-like surface antigen